MQVNCIQSNYGALNLINNQKRFYQSNTEVAKHAYLLNSEQRPLNFGLTKTVFFSPSDGVKEIARKITNAILAIRQKNLCQDDYVILSNMIKELGGLSKDIQEGVVGFRTKAGHTLFGTLTNSISRHRNKIASKNLFYNDTKEPIINFLDVVNGLNETTQKEFYFGENEKGRIPHDQVKNLFDEKVLGKIQNKMLEIAPEKINPDTAVQILCSPCIPKNTKKALIQEYSAFKVADKERQETKEMCRTVSKEYRMKALFCALSAFVLAIAVNPGPAEKLLTKLMKILSSSNIMETLVKIVKGIF